MVSIVSETSEQTLLDRMVLAMEKVRERLLRATESWIGRLSPELSARLRELIDTRDE
jgi:hypothetical protein